MDDENKIIETIILCIMAGIFGYLLAGSDYLKHFMKLYKNTNDTTIVTSTE